MAKKKENFKELSEGDLLKKLTTLREDLRTLTWKAEGAKSKNVKENSTIRKNIARVLTAINSK